VLLADRSAVTRQANGFVVDFKTNRALDIALSDQGWHQGLRKLYPQIARAVCIQSGWDQVPGLGVGTLELSVLYTSRDAVEQPSRFLGQTAPHFEEEIMLKQFMQVSFKEVFWFLQNLLLKFTPPTIGRNIVMVIMLVMSILWFFLFPSPIFREWYFIWKSMIMGWFLFTWFRYLSSKTIMKKWCHNHRFSCHFQCSFVVQASVSFTHY